MREGQNAGVFSPEDIERMAAAEGNKGARFLEERRKRQEEAPTIPDLPAVPTEPVVAEQKKSTPAREPASRVYTDLPAITPDMIAYMKLRQEAKRNRSEEATPDTAQAPQ